MERMIYLLSLYIAALTKTSEVLFSFMFTSVLLVERTSPGRRLLNRFVRNMMAIPRISPKGKSFGPSAKNKLG